MTADQVAEILHCGLGLDTATDILLSTMQELVKGVDNMPQAVNRLEASAAKFKLYDCPSNCKRLIPVKVNPPIWDKLKSETRPDDLKFQKIQSAISKSLIASVQVRDVLTKLLAASDERKKLLKVENLILDLTDTVALKHTRITSSILHAASVLNRSYTRTIGPRLH